MASAPPDRPPAPAGPPPWQRRAPPPDPDDRRKEKMERDSDRLTNPLPVEGWDFEVMTDADLSDEDLDDHPYTRRRKG